MNDLATSYLLWCGYFFGLAGLHRLYNGKIGTGLLWFCTWGLFGIGQVIDLALIPNMVEARHQRIRAKLDAAYGLQEEIALKVAPPTREQLMMKLLKAAAARGGKISVTQGVMATGCSFTQVETILREMVKSGYVAVDNDPKTGVVIYEFIELL